MAVAVRIRLDDREATRTLRALGGRQARVAVEGALDDVAAKIQRNAQTEQIIRGGRQAPHPTRLTSRTGTLRRSIRVNRPAPGVRSIGSDLVYAVHEFGIPRRNIRARPYLQPALEEEGPKLADQIRRRLKRIPGVS